MLFAPCSLSSLPAFMSSEGQMPSSEVQEVEGEQCGARLSCALSQSKEGALYDQHGIVGAVCTHCVPLEGTYCDLRGPENFVYYMVRRCFH